MFEFFVWTIRVAAAIVTIVAVFQTVDVEYIIALSAHLDLGVGIWIYKLIF